MSKTLIFVLGMHRSGTSALTRTINLLGATLGNDLLAAQEGVNERGFWEHKTLLDINERILNSMARRWYDIKPLPDNWANDKGLAGYRSTIRDFIEKNFRNHSLSALKDPRLCILLPIWSNALKGCELHIKALLMLRNPHEVVASICKRDPLDQFTAYLLWALHTRDAERHSRNMNRSIVSYDNLLDNWETTATHITADLGINWPVAIDEAREKIQAEISPKLKHQHKTKNPSSMQIIDLCERIYDAHLANAQHPELSVMDQLWDELQHYLGNSEELIATLSNNNHRLLDYLSEKQNLGKETNNLRQVLSETETTLGDTQAQLAALGNEHKQSLDTLALRDNALVTIQTQLAELGEKHQHALNIVAERDQQLKKIRTNPLMRTASKLTRLTGKQCDL